MNYDGVKMMFLHESEQQRKLLNPFTLSFRDKELNSLYRVDFVKKSLTFARTSLFLAIIIYLLFAALDPYIMDPEAASTIMQLRMIVSSLFIIAIILTYNKIISRFYQLLMFTVIITGGGIIVAMIAVSESSGGQYYYAGLILAVIYAHSLLRLRFIAALISTWLLVGSYEILAVNFQFTSKAIIINNTFFLVSANILGMFASYGIEYFMRMSFWRNLMLEEKTSLLEVEHKRKSKELEDARQIQLSMIPQNIPEHPLYDISFKMKTASEVGGDFFDIIISKDQTITFAVGDATGHGAKAGAMVTAMKFLFSNYAENMDIVEFLKKADHSLKQMHLPNLYMSFTIGRIKDDHIEVAGVGMPAMTMYNNNVSRLCKLALKGFPLGSTYDFPYKKHESIMAPNDVIMVMTDGLPELFNQCEETIGYDKVEKEFLKSAQKSPKEILDHLLNIADEWTNNYPQQDDITLLIIKKKAVRPAIIKLKPENIELRRNKTEKMKISC